MAILTRARVMERIGHVRLGPARRDSMQRVALRLAAQTVVLLLVMVIALEVVVYLKTQQALLGTLGDTLKRRASVAQIDTCYIFHVPCGRPGPSGGGTGHGRPPPAPQPQPRPRGNDRGFGNPVELAEAPFVYVGRNLRIVHSDPPGGVLISREDAQQALLTHQPQGPTKHSYDGEDYLVYTVPMRAQGRFVGVGQASISEHQYQSTMQSLLEALIVVALLGLLISGGISAVLANRALLPIRRAVQRQRDFVADAAHELRTPLAIQRTVGEVGMADASSDELQATVEQMLGQNQHLTRLVDDLSLLARTDTDTVRIDRRPVDLSTLVADTARELSFLAEEQGADLQAEVQDDVGVVGDMLRLRQLLLILLDNALKHTPASGTVRVTLAAPGGRPRLDVVDSGPGIDPEDLPRIFDRFYRADEARTGEGSGLGLAIAKWIVEAHGGQIRAGNASPHGAVFTVTLPPARTAAHA